MVIRRGRVPETLAAPRPGGNDLQFDGNDVLLNIPSAGRFLVRGGREIVIDQFASAGDDDVRAFLLGKVFGVLCHRRDITPFHACVVDLGGECAAFAGPSRAGKSTLAAALAKRGYQVIADDACFTRADADGAIMVWPGIRRIRLWQEAVEALGFEGAGIEREIRGYNKYLIPVAPPADPYGPRPLRRFYCLAKSQGDEAPEIERLHSADAIGLLLSNVYRIKLAERLGLMPAKFAACAAVARRVPVFRFRRPKRYELMNAGLDLLEAHFGARL